MTAPLIETPISPATFSVLSRQLGLTDRSMVTGLQNSGLLPDGVTVTEDMVRLWRGGGQPRENRGGSGRRPFRVASTYLLQLMKQVADHEEELVERFEAQYEETGEPITIYAPRYDKSILTDHPAAQEWGPYLGLTPVAQAIAGRVMLRLVDMGIPARIEYLDALLYRESLGDPEPAFRNDNPYRG